MGCPLDCLRNLGSKHQPRASRGPHVSNRHLETEALAGPTGAMLAKTQQMSPCAGTCKLRAKDSIEENFPAESSRDKDLKPHSRVSACRFFPGVPFLAGFRKEIKGTPPIGSFITTSPMDLSPHSVTSQTRGTKAGRQTLGRGLGLGR